MTGSRIRRLALPLALLAIVVPTVAVQAQTSGTRATGIATPPGGNPPADGSSDNVTFSQDNRVARLMAFDSAATNLVPNDANGRRDVFLFARGSAEGDIYGNLSLASVNSREQQANGDSVLPSIDGDTGHRPHCVAFTSNATNLARGDASPDWDVFVRDLDRGGRTTLASVRRTNAINGVVDGECEFVTFESGGRIWVRDLVRRTTSPVARGTNPDQQTNGKGVAYERGGQVYYQAFVRKYRPKRRGGPYVKRNGREVLVSANGAGRPGNGVSSNPALDDSGWYVAFESAATDLCTNVCTFASGNGADRNGATTDVFRRNINPRKAPTRDRMQMVSYSYAVDAQANGPSNNPQISGAGENVVFDSEATNLRESSGILIADGNGAIRDVYYWNYPRRRLEGNVSRESRSSQPRELGLGQPLNGPSIKPAMSSRANYIGWTTFATGEYGERNGSNVADIFLRFLGGE